MVCDDGSTDSTLHIIEEYSTASAPQIQIHRNDNNLGVCSNFQKAINLCHGDVVFLSDQDDIWRSDKVEQCVNYFLQHETVSLLFTDARLIDQNGETIRGLRLWETVGMTEQAQHHLDSGFGVELFAYANRATGATMAMRRTFQYAQSFIKYCNQYILHDYALSMLALSNNQLGYIPETLIDYRIHDNQQVGVGDYLDTPLTDSINRANYYTVCLGELNFPEPIGSRINFITQRYRHQNQVFGLIRIIASAHTYRVVYGFRAMTIVKSDITHWCKSMWQRAFHRKTK